MASSADAIVQRISLDGVEDILKQLSAPRGEVPIAGTSTGPRTMQDGRFQMKADQKTAQRVISQRPIATGSRCRQAAELVVSTATEQSTEARASNSGHTSYQRRAKAASRPVLLPETTPTITR